MRYLLRSKSFGLIKILLVSSCCLAALNANLEAKASSVSAFTYNPSTPAASDPATGTVFTVSTAGNALGLCQLNPPSGGATTGTQTYSFNPCPSDLSAGGTNNTAVAYLATPGNINNYFAMGADSGNVFLCSIEFQIPPQGVINQAYDISCGSSVEQFDSAVNDLAFDPSTNSLWVTTQGQTILSCPFVKETLEACTSIRDSVFKGIQSQNQIIVNPAYALEGAGSEILVALDNYVVSCYAGFGNGCSDPIYTSPLVGIGGNEMYETINGVAYNAATDTLYVGLKAKKDNLQIVTGLHAPNPMISARTVAQEINALAFSPYPGSVASGSPYIDGILLIGTENSSYVYAYDPIPGGDLMQIFEEFNGSVNSFLFDDNGNVLIQSGAVGLSIANPFLSSASAQNITTLIVEDADSEGNALGTATDVATLVYDSVEVIGKLAPAAVAATYTQPNIKLAAAPAPVSTPEPSAVAGLSLLVGLGLLSRRRS